MGLQNSYKIGIIYINIWLIDIILFNDEHLVQLRSEIVASPSVDG